MTKTVLITGASKGIGKSIALKLAENGYDLLITARNKEKLDALKKELQSFPVTVHAVQADLYDLQAIDTIHTELEKKFGQLDVLVNNAGTGISKTIEDTSVEDWEFLMNVNARAPFFLSKACIPLLKKSNAPTIVNIASVVGRLGYEKQGAYGASKHAFMGFSKALAKELQPYDIRIHTLAPGGVATDMVKEMRPDIDTGNLIQPGEMADLVWFLIAHRGNAMIDSVSIRRANGTPWA